MQNQLPEKFIEKLASYVPKEKMQQVMDGFAHPHAITFRTNTIKSTSDAVEKALNQLGFSIEHILWYKDGFILLNKSKMELMNTDLYMEGKIYIQNLSSMIPVLALDPKPGEIILDMAASPGSKTTQIASLMENTGTIIANDKSPKRIFKLIENLKSQGVTNTKVNTAPGEFLWRKYSDYFDKVLVDAPCSMEGRFNTNDPDSYKDWSPKKVKQLSNLQKWLLRSAISCTKIGGTIIYSTCALSPEENEKVIDWIFTKSGNAIEIEEINIPNLNASMGIKGYGKTIRIYPDYLMEGFFVAKMRKKLPTL